MAESTLTRQAIEKGLTPPRAKQAPLDHLSDARREASCIGLDIGDALRARNSRKRLDHINDAIGRAHQLIHQLKAAQAEAQGKAA